MKSLHALVITALFAYQPLLSANDQVSANDIVSAKATAHGYVPLSQLDTSSTYRQQIRDKFLHDMTHKCPIIFSAHNCQCVSGMMFDELTPVQQALIGEGFALAQQHPEKNEQEIGKLIEAKFGAANLQKKDIHARWKRAQLHSFSACHLPF